jgi:hypothetical protein
MKKFSPMWTAHSAHAPMSADRQTEIHPILALAALKSRMIGR